MKKKNSCVNAAPQGLGDGGVRYFLGAYCFYERDARINFGECSFDLKLKVLVHFLRVKRDLGTNSLPLFMPYPQTHPIRT